MVYIAMESQIKDGINDASLCFGKPDDDLASLTFVEKYDKYLRTDHSEADSDGDFVPDDSILRNEYAQLRSDAANQTITRNHRLSTGIPSKYRSAETCSNNDEDRLSVDDLPDDNKSEVIVINELIEKLESVRKRGPDGNSVFCTNEELEAIQQGYGEILDFIHDRSTTFEKIPNSKSSDEENESNHEEIEDIVNHDRDSSKSQDLIKLAEEMESVQKARDRFYEVEQQVKDHLDQLELVERYKMESVGR